MPIAIGAMCLDATEIPKMLDNTEARRQAKCPATRKRNAREECRQEMHQEQFVRLDCQVARID